MDTDKNDLTFLKSKIHSYKRPITNKNEINIKEFSIEDEETLLSSRISKPLIFCKK